MNVRVSVNIAARARSSKSLGILRRHLIRLRKAAGHGEAAAERFVDEYLERRVRDTLERHFMENYIRRQDGALEAIGDFRRRVAELYAEAGVKMPDPVELSRLYESLSKELGKLESLEAFIDRVPIKLAESAGAPAPKGPLTKGAALERVFGRNPDTTLAKMSPADRQRITRAAELEPDMFSRAVAEAEASHQRRAIGDPPAPNQTRVAFAEWLKRVHGISDGKAKATIEQIEKIGRQRHEEGQTALRATERAAFDSLVERMGDPAFERAARRRDGEPYRYVEIAAREMPGTVAELWRLYKSGGSKQPFHRYLEMISRRHHVGAAGEYHAAWIFGGEYFILKGPDANVTIPGTDLILVHKKSGKVFPIDNKAWRATLVDSVPALLENLPKNLVDDMAALRRRNIGGDPGLPAAVSEAPGKIATANREIAALLQKAFPGEKVSLGGEKVKDWLKDPANNAEVQKILDGNGIEPRVTGAGGQVEGVVQHLKNFGIDYLDEPPVKPLPPVATGGRP